METVTHLIQQLCDPHTAYFEKKQLIVQLRDLAISHKGSLFIANLTKLFHTLEQLLELDKADTKLPEVSMLVIELLSIMVDKADPETEILLTKFLQTIIPCLSTGNAALKKNVIGYISRYLIRTKNYEAVFAAVNRLGLETGNWRLKAAGLEGVEAWWRVAASSSSGDALGSIPESKKMLQNVIKHLKDSSEVVREKAYNAIISMTKTLPKTVNVLVAKLPVASAAEYRELMVREHIDNSTKLGEMPVDEDVKKALASAQYLPRKNPEWPEADGLVFGVVPNRVMRDLGPSANLKERSAAVEELKGIVTGSTNMQRLEMYFSSFFKFIVQLLSDNNYKVSVCTMQMLITLLSEKRRRLNARTNLHMLIPGLVEKFGDSKIVVRQLAQESFSALSLCIKPKVLLNELVPFLESSNWHVREEILLFIIRTFLLYDKKKDEEGHDILQDVDYPKLVNAVAKLLDDDKPKVIQIVYETVATIAQLGNYTKVLEILLEAVDHEVYRKLCDRVEAGALPVLRSEGGLEFPYLAFGLSTQNSFYSSIQGFRSSTTSISGSAKLRGTSLAKEHSAPLAVDNKLNNSALQSEETSPMVAPKEGYKNRLTYLKKTGPISKCSRTFITGKINVLGTHEVNQ
eukprot:TRINITY_DN5375_c0_g2_i7.p1 TRINITY_DN5375_c0_g2~~TRINITY_DN5375_c0_g2_i7.p1  ORF type:complete len:630 (+),score=165.47 TRINITY_DN5375_c0_g2_i7:172-2061(+)